MARSIKEIKADICADFMSNSTMVGYYGFESGADFDDTFSKVSFEGILFYIISSAIYVVESLFDTHKDDVDTAIEARKTGNLYWVTDMAKAFQYGDAFNEETGEYDETDEDKQIISYAAASENDSGTVSLKVAKASGDDLAALSADELTAFEAYIKVAKYAGVIIDVISDDGDDLALEIDVYYDPLVLNSSGESLEDGGTPVPDAVKAYLQDLPFNGEFDIASLEDALQEVDGVKIPNTLSAKSKYADNDWVVIDAKVKPYAGYFVIDDENLTINPKAYDGN